MENTPMHNYCDCGDYCEYCHPEMCGLAVNVYDYFTQKFGEYPTDETLKDLPINTPCGKDCKTAIDGAVLLLDIIDSSLRSSVVTIANEAIEIFWRG